MAIAVNTTNSWYDGKRLTVLGTLTFSGNYSTGGDTINLAGVKGFLTSQLPLTFQISGQSGFFYQFVVGTTLANAKVKVLVATTGGTNIPQAEHTAVAYVAGVTGDVVTFEAILLMR